MLGEKLKHLRRKKNRSQEDVAKDLGITRAKYSHIENGRNEPDNETLVQLANYYDVSVDYLLNVANVQRFKEEDAISVPIVGTIKAGVDGLAYEYFDGFASFTKNGLNPNNEYFALRVKGDSMIGDGIYDGDLALVEKDAPFVQNKIYAVIVNGEEGTLKHVTINNDHTVLSASNPIYPPRILSGDLLEQTIIVGRMIKLERSFMW